MSKEQLLWLVLIALGIGLAVLVVLLAVRDPGVISRDAGGPSLVHSIALLAILAASAVLHRHLKPGHVLKYLSIWLATGTVLVLAYSFRHDAANIVDRLVAEVMPSRGLMTGGEVNFRAEKGGHFIVDAQVDGVQIQFLVDTGASDVTLTPHDARRLGFDLNRLNYDRTYRTANGAVKGAPVRLHRLSVRHILLADVRASVNSTDMNRSLLGMSFLSRLSSFEVAHGILTLRP